MLRYWLKQQVQRYHWPATRSVTLPHCRFVLRVRNTIKLNRSALKVEASASIKARSVQILSVIVLHSRLAKMIIIKKVLLSVLFVLFIDGIDCQLWNTQKFKDFPWFRLPRMATDVTTIASTIKKDTTIPITSQTYIDNSISSASSEQQLTTIKSKTNIPLLSTVAIRQSTLSSNKKSTTNTVTNYNTNSNSNNKNINTNKMPITLLQNTTKFTTITPKTTLKQVNQKSTSSTSATVTEHADTTTDETYTTLDSRDNARVNENHNLPIKREKPQVKIAANISQVGVMFNHHR